MDVACRVRNRNTKERIYDLQGLQRVLHLKWKEPILRIKTNWRLRGKYCSSDVV